MLLLSGRIRRHPLHMVRLLRLLHLQRHLPRVLMRLHAHCCRMWVSLKGRLVLLHRELLSSRNLCLLLLLLLKLLLHMRGEARHHLWISGGERSHVTAWYSAGYSSRVHAVGHHSWPYLRAAMILSLEYHGVCAAH